MKPSDKLLFSGLLALALLDAGGTAFSARAAPPEVMAATGSYAPMLAKVIPAVVTIRVIGETFSAVDIPVRPVGSKSPPETPTPEKTTFRAGGSGVIIDGKNGYILTNNHVIDNAKWIQVGLSTGRRMMAEVVGRDIGTDVAVLKVSENNLPAIAIGDSDAMQVGDVVAAVGNPFGLEGTATLGIVSALMRTTVGHGTFEDYIQIDAPINPGNSGGALANTQGELIGINTVTGGGPGTNLGIGFAIPINMAMVIKDELINAGRMRRGSPGLIVEDLPEEMASPKEGGVIRGALVTKVLPNSSGAAAGVKPGDIVVSVANKPVRSAAEYTTRTETVPLGTSLPFILFSEGKGKVVKLEATDIVLEPDGRAIPDSAGSIAGAVVGEILLGNPLYGDVRGAQVLNVPEGTPASSAGLLADDVIIGLDSADVRSVDNLFQRFDRAGAQYRIKILRNGVPGWVRVSR